GIGATATGVVLVIVTISKFTHGAWIVISVMPVIVLFFHSVHRHYERVGRVLRSSWILPNAEPSNVFVVVVSEVGLATSDAVAYLRAVRPEHVAPVFTGDPARFAATAEAWGVVAPRLGELRALP